jgi:hypothetical protein
VKIPYVLKGAPSQAFKDVFPDTKGVFKPQIKLAIQYGAIKETIFALVDSGADACLFPRGIGGNAFFLS